MNSESEFIIDYISRAVELYPNHIALIDVDWNNGNGTSITYHEMWCRDEIVASQIKSIIKSSLSHIEGTPLVSIMMNRGLGQARTQPSKLFGGPRREDGSETGSWSNYKYFGYIKSWSCICSS